MADAFTIEPTSNGWRIVNQFGRTVVPAGIPTYGAAQEMAALLGSGKRFRGRAVVMDGVRRAQRKDQDNTVRMAQGSTAARPIKGAKRTITESSKPRGY